MRFTRDGLLTAILVVAALFVGSTLTQYLPKPDDFRDDPFPVAGAFGEPVRLRNADITVTKVQAARTVELFGQVAATDGVWLVLDVTYAPRHEPGVLVGSQPLLSAPDGRRFGGLQAITKNCGPANPGLPVACQLPIEVPADALEGLVLTIPAENGQWENDEVTEIDLGITAERAAELRASEAQVTLQEPTVARP